MTTSSVERVAAPNRREFERNYLSRGTPVVLRGAMDGWRALERWSLDYVAREAGHHAVGVTYNPDGVYKSKSEKRMPLASYLELLASDDPERRKHYLTLDLGRELPELRGDYALPPHLDPSDGAELHLFLGRDSVTGCHFHPYQQNTLAQIHGKKRVVLFAPGQFELLYPEFFLDDRFNFSRVDLDSPDPARFPRFREARPLTVTLEPGEMLFIPVHWWHAVWGEDVSISAAFFWQASLRHYHFPHPALRCFAKSPRLLLRPLRRLGARG